MRRAKLIWFALGAATSGIATTIVAAAFNRPEPNSLVLRIDDIRENTATEMPEILATQYRAGELARQCGADDFRTTAVSDGNPLVEVPVEGTHENALNCILEEGSKRNLPVTLFRTPAE